MQDNLANNESWFDSNFKIYWTNQTNGPFGLRGEEGRVE